MEWPELALYVKVAAELDFAEMKVRARSVEQAPRRTLHHVAPGGQGKPRAAGPTVRLQPHAHGRAVILRGGVPEGVRRRGGRRTAGRGVGLVDRALRHLLVAVAVVELHVVRAVAVVQVDLARVVLLAALAARLHLISLT